MFHICIEICAKCTNCCCSIQFLLQTESCLSHLSPQRGPHIAKTPIIAQSELWLLSLVQATTGAVDQNHLYYIVAEALGKAYTKAQPQVTHTERSVIFYTPVTVREVDPDKFDKTKEWNQITGQWLVKCEKKSIQTPVWSLKSTKLHTYAKIQCFQLARSHILNHRCFQFFHFSNNFSIPNKTNRLEII